MQEQIEALKEEIEELNARIEELEAQLSDIECAVVDNEGLAEVSLVQEFAYLDDFPKHSEENVIILHSNPYRTFKLVDSCQSSCGIRSNLNHMDKFYLTPEHFKGTLAHAKKGEYIMLNSEVFDFAEEFEALILNAVEQGEVFFILLTNNLEKIPQSIREKMSVLI